MSELAAQIAQMFCVGFDGHEPDAGVRELVRAGIGAVALFSRNVGAPEQVHGLCAALKAEAPDRPLVIGIDQEGGRVQRLRDPFTDTPSMRELGRCGDADLAQQIGAMLARELRAVGIDLNFAPVLDVDTNPANPVIASRSLADTPEEVIRLAIPLIRGLQSGGIAACGKHFPGHGDTAQDSHLDLPRLPHDMDRLERVELPPFAAAARAQVAGIMSAHVVFEPLDRHYPATMSPAVLDGLLRRRLGFGGVILSDDLEMKAIANHFDFDDVVLRGVEAGVDLFLICHTHELVHRAIDTIRRAVERGEVSADRIAASANRLRQMADRYARPVSAALEPGVVGCAAHRELVEVVCDRAGAPHGDAEHDPTEQWRA